MGNRIGRQDDALLTASTLGRKGRLIAFLFGFERCGFQKVILPTIVIVRRIAGEGQPRLIEGAWTGCAFGPAQVVNNLIEVLNCELRRI